MIKITRKKNKIGKAIDLGHNRTNLQRYMIYAAFIVFAMIFCYGIIISIYMNCVNRSLWLDEAMLAWSFSKRDLLSLTNGRFEWGQIAPAGWLYIEKVISIIFGNSEFVLRLFSIFSLIMVSIVAFALLKNYFNTNTLLAMACSAYIVTIKWVLLYSNMFKPYISDGLFVLLTICLWILYERKKISAIELVISYCGIILCSNPAFFYMGGLLIVSFIAARIEKDKRKSKVILISGLSVIIFFSLYYFRWMSEAATDMQLIWEAYRLPLFSYNIEDLRKAFALISGLFSYFDRFKSFLMLMLLVTLAVSLIEKDKCLIGIYLGTSLCVIASGFGFFPIHPRLCMFVYPLFSVLMFIGIDRMVKWPFRNGNVKMMLLMTSGIVLTIGNMGPRHYCIKENVYWQGEEIKDEIVYLQNNIQEDEKVYVYWHSVPAFQYHNGYDNDNIGKYEENVIFGSTLFRENDDYGKEVKRITDLKKCYIVLSHYSDDRIQGLMEELGKCGYLELVQYEHSTPLLFWTSIPETIKTKVEMEINSFSKLGDMVKAEIELTNVGESILNSPLCPVYLYSDALDRTYELPHMINRDNRCTIEIEYPADISSGFYLINGYGNKIDVLTDWKGR